MQDDLNLGLRAGNVGHLADRNAQTSTQQTTEVGWRVRKLVLLATSLVNRDEDAHVVLAGGHPDASASELGSDLVEPTSTDALLRTRNVESRHRRMVTRLLRQVGD